MSLTAMLVWCTLGGCVLVLIVTLLFLTLDHLIHHAPGSTFGEAVRISARRLVSPKRW